jgi:FHS family glucose/mannose:H+ symporter-like MFS transporter
VARIVNRSALFWAACGGIFVFGIVLALLGTLFGLPGMRERLGIDLAGQGNLFLLLYAGIFAASLVGGPLIDHVGNKVVLTASSLLVALAMAGFALADTFALAGGAALALGLGGGGLNAANNVLVSDLYPENRGPRLNILGTFFGVGALCIPLAAAGLAARLSVTRLLAGSAVLAGLSAVAYAALAFPSAHEAETFSWSRAARVVRYPGVLLFGLLLLFQSGNEASIGGWTSTYVGEVGWSTQVATWVLSGYWAALMLARLLSARLLSHAAKPRLVLLSGVGSAAGCVLLLVASSLPLVATGVVLLGASYANVYPTTLAMVGDRYQRFTGTVFGVLFSIALVGGMAFPWAIGHISQALGVRAGMLLPLSGAIAVCVLIVMVGRKDERPV